jgi:hypothetical protein
MAVRVMQKNIDEAAKICQENSSQEPKNFENIVGPLKRTGASYRGNCPSCHRDALIITPRIGRAPGAYCIYCRSSEPRRILMDAGVEIGCEIHVDHDEIKGICEYWFGWRARCLILTPAEVYLRSCGIDVRLLLPSILNELLFFKYAKNGSFYYPAMIARKWSLFGDKNGKIRPAGVHITYLQDNGKARPTLTRRNGRAARITARRSISVHLMQNSKRRPG